MESPFSFPWPFIIVEIAKAGRCDQQSPNLRGLMQYRLISLPHHGPMLARQLPWESLLQAVKQVSERLPSCCTATLSMAGGRRGKELSKWREDMKAVEEDTGVLMAQNPVRWPGVSIQEARKYIFPCAQEEENGTKFGKRIALSLPHLSWFYP